MLIETIKIPYLKRVWKQVDKTIYVLCSTTVILTILKTGKISYLLISVLFTISILLILKSLQINKYFLQFLKIEEDRKSIIIKFLKYNTIIEKEVTADNIDIRITRVFSSLRPYFKIIFYFDKNEKIEIYETVKLNSETLNDIYVSIKRLK